MGLVVVVAALAVSHYKIGQANRLSVYLAGATAGTVVGFVWGLVS